MPRSLLTFTAALVVVAIVFCALIFGRDLLIPFAVAIMIWYLLNALARGLSADPHRRLVAARLDVHDGLRPHGDRCAGSSSLC